MKPATILQSDILDIIFENRNKEYGAYFLRRYYNSRLAMALLIMLSFVILFSLAQIFVNKDSEKVEKIFKMKDYELSNFEPKTKAIIIPVKPRAKGKVLKAHEETTPEIVDDKKINKITASISPTGASNLISQDEPIGFEGSGGVNKTFAAPENVVPVSEKKEKKPEIYSFAEVMPQYPGGLKALLAFLKKNLKAPDEVEAGNEITVKVKFVVNFDGQLESFNVIQSGGEVFDKEVLRVLKKMPLWIPGKSKGENVSVYFIVPVRFTGF